MKRLRFVFVIMKGKKNSCGLQIPNCAINNSFMLYMLLLLLYYPSQ
jgi:hypothetical protein